MPQSDLELMHRLKRLENTVQEQDSSLGQIKQVIEEVKGVIQDLDKTVAIQAEKQSHLFYRIEQLEKELVVLGSQGEKTNNRQRDLVEKALMAFLGGLITYVFSLSSK